MQLVCSICSQLHEHWPPELAFVRPDEVWLLDPARRRRRCKENDDLCVLKGERFWHSTRHFIRCVLQIPVLDAEDTWAIGFWAEVSRWHFNRYLRLFEADASGEPPFRGTLANGFPRPDLLIETPMQIRLGKSSDRPRLYFLPGSNEMLAKMQTTGVTTAELHGFIQRDAPQLLAAQRAPNQAAK